MPEGSPPMQGIHHVTAIAGDPQDNLDFYTGFLGLRLVKKTVNFDDPGTYHLYYGDEQGSPGTLLTFFPWPDIYRGRSGSGQAVQTSFRVPEHSLDFWMERFAEEAFDFSGPETRFGTRWISFQDPDGLSLELVADPEAAKREARDDSPIPGEHAIRGFYSVTLSLEGYESTARVLVEALEYQSAGEEGGRFRFRIPGSKNAATLDLLCRPQGVQGRMGAGTVHHIAFRVPDPETQLALREKILALGLNPTPVIDRIYFRSVYFREPGGVLFEIATDGPGFLIDEEVESLGRSLKLPPWLERKRTWIEERLPELIVGETPGGG